MFYHPQWRIATNTLASLSFMSLSYMFYHSDKLVSTNVIFSTILDIFYNACLGYIVQYTFVRRSSFNVLHHIPVFPLLLVLVAIPSVVKANVDELDINGTMTSSLTGAAAAAVTGGAVSSAMDSVEKFTMEDMKLSREQIDNWTPKYKNSIIHIIVIRMSPSTTTHNDGLGQIIACVLLVWLLNLWGNVSDEKHEIFPQIISLDGSRDNPKECKGYADLFHIIRHHRGLSGHHVRAIARTGLRYAEDPKHLERNIEIAKEVVVRRNADTSKAIPSFEFKAMDSYFIKSTTNQDDGTITSGIVQWRTAEYECVSSIKAAEGSHIDVALDYSDVVPPKAKKKQDRTNILASEKINDLIYSTADGDDIRRLVMDGFVADGSGIPDVDMLSMLKDAMPKLKEGGHKQEEAVAGMIESVRKKAQTMNMTLSPNLARAKAVSFTRRSGGGSSHSIGDSANVVMGGARTLPRHQVVMNLSALDVMHKVQNDVVFIHAESVRRDRTTFHEGHANLLVLLILSDMNPFVAASTLVRFGADIVIITTVLEFIRQLETTLVIADCIGYDVKELAKNENRRKLKSVIERSELVETKEDIISKLDEEEQRRHRVMTTVGAIKSLCYEEAQELQDEDIKRNVNERRASTRRAALMEDPEADSFEGNQKMPAEAAAAKKAPAKKKASRRDDSDDESDIEFMGQSATSVKPSRSRTARATTKKPKYNYDDSDVEEINDSEEAETPAPKARGKKKVAGSVATTKARAPSQTQSTMTSAASGFTSTRGRRNVQYLDSDSDDDEPSSSFGTGGACRDADSFEGKKMPAKAAADTFESNQKNPAKKMPTKRQAADNDSDSDFSSTPARPSKKAKFHYCESASSAEEDSKMSAAARPKRSFASTLPAKVSTGKSRKRINDDDV